MAWVKRVCALAAFGVVGFVGFLLMLDNATPVALRLLDRETEPLAVYWWLYAAFACGFVLGVALCMFAYVRGRLGERRLRKIVHQREAELARFRAASTGGDEAKSPASGT